MFETSARSKMTEEPSFSVSRDIDAARELVWRMWTEADMMKRWWGPKGFSTTFCKIDFHVGGKFLMCERGPDGKDMWTTGKYREIVPLLRIVCSVSFADEKGNVVPASFYGMTGNFPLEMLWTIVFEDHFSRTRLTVRHSGISPGVDTDNAKQGWEQSFDKLKDAVKK